MTDPFEIRLTRGLRDYADGMVRPTDPEATARALVATSRSRSGLGTGFRGAGAGLRLILALGLVLLVVAGFFVAVGGSLPALLSRPSSAPTMPSPVASSFDARPPQVRALVLDGPWGLDFAASGLADHFVPSVPNLRLYVSLTFNDTGWEVLMYSGGGCGEATGPYLAGANDIDLSLQGQNKSCGPGSPAEIISRLEAAVSFALSDCLPASSGAVPSCDTLTISGAAGASPLVYRSER